MELVERMRRKAEMFSVSFEWSKEKRLKYLRDEIDWFSDWSRRANQFMSGASKIEMAFILQGLIEGMRVLNEMEREMWILENHDRQRLGEITDEMIKKAKEYPVELLLPNPIKRNMTKCPFHNDRNPSLWIKNNFAYCFSCGRGWDTIALVRELEKLSFKDAVKRLCGG